MYHICAFFENYFAYIFYTFVTMMHKGEIIENAIRQSGYSITEMAKKLKISRRHLYNLFQKYNIDNDTILQIGKLINHDFSGEIKNITSTSMAEEPVGKYATEMERIKTELEIWKNKYIHLLEDHKKLLEKIKAEER
jgi:plasmid maintenance system antidote protein VapI